MNFREFETSSGKKVLAGKSAQNNEDLISQVDNEEIVLHTAKPGSPFANIKDKKPTKKDITEAATFCALKSQDWRDNKKDVVVHYFKGKDVFKEKKMKSGMFGVKKFLEIKIKAEDIKKLEEKLK